MDDINLGLYPRPRLCLLGLTTNQMNCSGVRVFTVELLWTVFLTAVATSLPTPPPLPPTRPPPQYAGPKLVHTLKKRPKI